MPRHRRVDPGCLLPNSASSLPLALFAVNLFYSGMIWGVISRRPGWSVAMLCGQRVRILDGYPAMRKIATLTHPVNGVRRVMLYEADGGTYLFLYTSTEDGPCKYDSWYESLGDAEEAAAESFGVKPQDWTVIDDPPPRTTGSSRPA